MGELAIFFLVVASLFAGACIGVAFLGWYVAAEVRRGLVLTADGDRARARARAAQEALLDGSDELVAADREGAEALEAFRAAQTRPREAFKAPTRDARELGRPPGCGWCKKARKALFG